MGKPGRPIGSKTRPQIRDNFTKEEIKKLVDKAKKLAEKGDVNLLKFLLEQIFGKAVQPIGNDDGEPLLIKFDNAFTYQATRSRKE